jgi:hypothetical protein
MIPVNFPNVGTILPRRDVMLRVFSPIGFNVIFSANKVFESRILGISGFHGGWRTSSFWGLNGR